MEALETKELFEEDAPPPPPPKPRTVTVLCLLAVAAATFSYLGAFAVTDALARAEIIQPIRHQSRPRLAIIIFVSLIVLFVGVAMLMRFLSWRHFRRIDKMLDADKSIE